MINMSGTTALNNVEQLADRYKAIPRIDETGPKKGYNGPLMTVKGIKWRIVHLIACIIGLLPIVLSLAGTEIPQWMISVGFGFVVPGGGFMATGGALTMPIGVLFCLWLWRKKGMFLLERYGSSVGVIGFWILGAIAGLLVLIQGTPIDFLFGIKPYWWGYILTIVVALYHFGNYELRTRELYKRLAATREHRVKNFDVTMKELDDIMENYHDDSPRELTEEQLRGMRHLFQASTRKFGDLEGFGKKGRHLMGYQYLFSVVGMTYMMMQQKYTPNFHGYLKYSREFLLDAVTDPRTCSYWAKQSLLGYWKWNTDPIIHSNVMLSGWLMPMLASFEECFQDDKYQKDGSLTFKPAAKKPIEHPYSAKAVNKALYDQYHSKMYPYMYIPCEPHLAFPVCNSYGVEGMLIYDRIHGTHYMADIFDDLYDNMAQEFTEIEGSMALRRQYTFGLRHLPASQLGKGYDPMADVQNYLQYAALFPGLCKRAYAFIRRDHIELRDGVVYIKGKKWEEVFDMATQSLNPALAIAMLEIVAAEYGDTEVVEGLKKAEEIYLTRSKDPKVVRWENVPLVISAWLHFAHMARKGDWTDIILRGMPESAKIGPYLDDCKFPEVLVAKAASDGADLDLVLYNGEEPGEQMIKIARLQPNANYKIKDMNYSFTADKEGTAEIKVNLDGRTQLHIVPAAA